MTCKRAKHTLVWLAYLYAVPAVAFLAWNVTASLQGWCGVVVGDWVKPPSAIKSKSLPIALSQCRGEAHLNLSSNIF
jgi:hypothetical protein